MKGVATAAFQDVLISLGIPTTLLALHHERRLRHAAGELRSQLHRREITLADACEKDQNLDQVYSYFIAAVSGVAQDNISLLAKLLGSSLESHSLYPDDFTRLKDIIARLSGDEIVVIASIYNFSMSPRRKTTNHVLVGSAAEQLELELLTPERVEQMIHSLIGKGLLAISVSPASFAPTVIHARPTNDLLAIARMAEEAADA